MTLNCCSITTSSMELDPLCDLTRFRLQASTSDIFEECPQVSLITLFTVCTSPYVAALLSLSTFFEFRSFPLYVGRVCTTPYMFVRKGDGKKNHKCNGNVRPRAINVHCCSRITIFGMKVFSTLLFGHPLRWNCVMR